MVKERKIKTQNTYSNKKIKSMAKRNTSNNITVKQSRANMTKTKSVQKKIENFCLETKSLDNYWEIKEIQKINVKDNRSDINNYMVRVDWEPNNLKEYAVSEEPLINVDTRRGMLFLYDCEDVDEKAKDKSLDLLVNYYNNCKENLNKIKETDIKFIKERTIGGEIKNAINLEEEIYQVANIVGFYKNKKEKFIKFIKGKKIAYSDLEEYEYFLEDDYNEYIQLKSGVEVQKTNDRLNNLICCLKYKKSKKQMIGIKRKIRYRHWATYMLCLPIALKTLGYVITLKEAIEIRELPKETQITKINTILKKKYNVRLNFVKQGRETLKELIIKCNETSIIIYKNIGNIKVYHSLGINNGNLLADQNYYENENNIVKYLVYNIIN